MIFFPEIHTWKQFHHRVRRREFPLLQHLNEFPNAVLVSGCQRSGTTLLARIIRQSVNIDNFPHFPDDELFGALILAGLKTYEPRSRCCFQTTYLNENYYEYFQRMPERCRLIWVLRNPFSVVYSMLYNWQDFALNEVFRACGAHLMQDREKKRYKRWGLLGVNRTRRACYSYAGKIEQLFAIYDHLGPDRVLIINYDQMVMEKERILTGIFSFIDETCPETAAAMIRPTSIDKKDQLPDSRKKIIQEIALPIFQKAVSTFLAS